MPEEEAARDHLLHCDGCRAFFLRDAQISDLLRGLREGIEVRSPGGLRLSVARALDVGRPDAAEGAGQTVLEVAAAGEPRFRGRKLEVAAAAAAAILLIGGQLVASRYGGDAETSRFAADFVRTAAVDFDRPGLDVRQIGGFYERELGRVIVPVALHEAPVTRATVCDLAGDLGSMVEYDLGGTRLVHYRIPLDPNRSGAPVADAPVSVESQRGVQVAHWADGEFEHALVSRVEADYLVWLARNRFTRPPAITNYGSPASRSWRRVAAGE